MKPIGSNNSFYAIFHFTEHTATHEVSPEIRTLA
jgi:hypothetical protein